ncbi:hypothetical protein AB0442_33990 [Kitasatospora sp. NPDC085895]|uniref:hypothetical protein n=1 Tax=Kitasatospora sp. NPDC085895 TaxID=3155057 RepID=UPI00344F227C
MSSDVPAESVPVPPNAHLVALQERGSFCFASCSCGWLAPGRRSRDRARRDADEHRRDGTV